jgi:exodeoxyribonuclease V alpha subunit
MKNNSVFARKFIEDINISKIGEGIKNNQTFPHITQAIQELIQSGQEGNLCILSKEEFRKQLAHLPKDSLILEDNYLYFQKTFVAKVNLEKSFQSLISYTKNYRDKNNSKYSEEHIDKLINEIEISWGSRKDSKTFKLKEGQRKAIIEAVQSPFHIITGGPGTGKTTVVAFLMEVLSKLGELPPVEDIALAAPTGRAGQRLTESIQENWNLMNSGIQGREQVKGTTIHRLLRFQIHNQSYYYNIDRSFLHRFILIDEVSMVDLFLFNSLLLAIPDLTWETSLEPNRIETASNPENIFPFRLILLGDPNQLPSVEKGAVLNDILNEIKSELTNQSQWGGFLLTDLVESNRHSSPAGKEILKIAEDVLKGENPKNLGDFWIDFKLDTKITEPIRQDFKIREESCKFLWENVFKKQMETILEKNLSITEGLLPNKEDFDKWTTENKCLTLYKRGLFGIEGLQNLLDIQIRKFLIDPRRKKIPSVSIDNRLYYPGLPLIITKNDSIRKLFNGDIGYVLLVDKELRACFSIDGEIRCFALDTLPDHEEAYFLTVHKSQGSEYENLYFYIPPVRTERKTQPESEEIEDNSNISLANRQILYTGITRAKSNLKIFGSKEGWEEGIKNLQNRLTGFKL